MRIAYIGRWSLEPSDGVGAKVSAQAAEWRSRGHDVVLFRLPPVGYARRTDAGDRSPSAHAITASVIATARLRRSVARYSPDIAYIRYGFYLPRLRPLQIRHVSVIELNTNDRIESVARDQHGRRALNAASRRWLLGNARGLICVAHEIARDAAPLGKPMVVIANGAHLDTIVVPVPVSSKRPLAVFLAGVPMPWHGIDKLLALARAMPECDFALVGVGHATLPEPPPPNVKLHPPMRRADYVPILARADVGIGSLAMHRAGLSEASPLKVREYLAHGLPVVIGFEDTDFAGTQPWYILRLPNTESNVRDDVDRIRRFIVDVRGRRVARHEVADRIDSRAKETARLRFMNDLLAQGPTPRRR